MSKICNHCKEYKEEDQFNWRYKSLGIRHPTCRECMSLHQKKYFQGDAHDRHLKQVKDRKYAVRDVAREYILDYLSKHPCSQCGEADPMVLEFHHEHSKEYPVSAMINGGYPIHRIQAEIEKCIVLCANCHRKLTMKERGWYRGRR